MGFISHRPWAGFHICPAVGNVGCCLSLPPAGRVLLRGADPRLELERTGRAQTWLEMHVGAFPSHRAPHSLLQSTWEGLKPVVSGQTPLFHTSSAPRAVSTALLLWLGQWV